MLLWPVLLLYCRSCRGPLGWLLPIEIQPQETRAAGTALSIIVSNLWTFVVGQVFLSMLCTMKYGVFIFFAGGFDETGPRRSGRLLVCIETQSNSSGVIS